MTEFRLPQWRRRQQLLGPTHDPTLQIQWSLTFGDTQHRWYRSYVTLTIGTDFWAHVRIQLHIRRRRTHTWTMQEPLRWARMTWRDKMADAIVHACMVQFDFLEERYTSSWVEDPMGVPEP